MASPSKINAALIIDIIGSIAMAALVYLYSIYASTFAEIHLTLKFLDFPIFIGEIILLFVGILFMTKLAITKQLSKWHFFFLIFVAWVSIGAIVDYFSWGALSFRNAALFYYMCFAGLAYSFYNARVAQHHLVSFFICVILMVSVVAHSISNYYWFTVAMIVTAIVFKCCKGPARFWILGGFFAFSHLPALFASSRAHLFGIAVSLLYIIITLIVMYAKRIRKVHVASGIGIIVLLGFLFMSHVDHNSLKSLIDWPDLVRIYKKHTAFIEVKKDQFCLRPIAVKLYNPNSIVSTNPMYWPVSTQPDHLRSSGKFADTVNFKLTYWNQTGLSPTTERIYPLVSYGGKDMDGAFLTEKMSDRLSPMHPTDVMKMSEGETASGDKYRDIHIAKNNILFRFFIWKDMIDEIVQGHKWLGIGFGQPQRSVSIEILGWADSEWVRDGWITPHNSFLHMVYRAGIIGFIILVVLFSTLVYLSRIFMQRQDLAGIFLISIMIYWSMQASFSVILELPHYAILYWSLLGMIIAYAFPKKEVTHV